jgi:hypothetical protein
MPRHSETGRYMGYLDGYETATEKDNPPYAAFGTETENEDKGPGPKWAKRSQKSDPHTGAKSGT